jgi:hypothetical protein
VGVSITGACKANRLLELAGMELSGSAGVMWWVRWELLPTNQGFGQISSPAPSSSPLQLIPAPPFPFLHFVCLCSFLPTFQPRGLINYGQCVSSSTLKFRALDFELLVPERKLLDWYQDSVECPRCKNGLGKLSERYRNSMGMVLEQYGNGIRIVWEWYRNGMGMVWE